MESATIYFSFIKMTYLETAKLYFYSEYFNILGFLNLLGFLAARFASLDGPDSLDGPGGLSSGLSGAGGRGTFH